MKIDKNFTGIKLKVTSHKDRRYFETFYHGNIEIYENGRRLYSVRSPILRTDKNDAMEDAKDLAKDHL